VSFAGSKKDQDMDVSPTAIEKILKFVIEESEAELYVAE
jgi:hypothetical protein